MLATARPSCSIIQMAATAILDFWNCKILSANEVLRVDAHLHAKNIKISIDCENIKIFLFF